MFLRSRSLGWIQTLKIFAIFSACFHYSNYICFHWRYVCYFCKTVDRSRFCQKENNHYCSTFSSISALCWSGGRLVAGIDNFDIWFPKDCNKLAKEARLDFKLSMYEGINIQSWKRKRKLPLNMFWKKELIYQRMKLRKCWWGA